MNKEQFVEEMKKRGVTFLPMNSRSTVTFSKNKEGKQTVHVQSEPIVFEQDFSSKKKKKKITEVINDDAKNQEDRENMPGAWQKRQSKDKKKKKF